MENYKEDFNKRVVAADGTPNAEWKELWYKATKCEEKDGRLQYNEITKGSEKENRYIDILKYDRKWGYQNRDLEDRYELFKKRRDQILQPEYQVKYSWM